MCTPLLAACPGGVLVTRQLSNLEAAIVVVEMDMLLTALDVVKWSI